MPPVRPAECKVSDLWGRKDHGGWYVCLDSLGGGDATAAVSVFPASTPQKYACVVYSFGLGADWSFDKAAEKFGCSVHGFDPTNLLVVLVILLIVG